MKDFEAFYKELTSDEIWFEPVKMHHKPETLQSIGRRVYMHGIADKDHFLITPMSEFRRHFYNIVCKTPGDKPKNKDWYVKALEKIEPKIIEEPPLAGEERMKRIQEWKESLEGLEMISSVPRMTVKQIIEEGDWRAVSTVEPRDEFQRRLALEEHKEKVAKAREQMFRKAYPDASEEEVQAYIDKFEIL